MPEKVDGATVRWIAHATPGQTGHVQKTGKPGAIAYYVIAQYERDGERVYLFGVNADWEVVEDTQWESADEAKSVASYSGIASPALWQARD